MPALDVNAWRRWAQKASGREIADAVDALGQLRTELVRDAQRAGKAVPATGAAATKSRAAGGGTSGSASSASRTARKRPRDTSTTAGSGGRAGTRPPDGRDAQGRQRAGKATPPATVAEPDAPSRYPATSDGGAPRDAQGRRIYDSEQDDSRTYGNKRQRRRTRSRDAHGRTR